MEGKFLESPIGEKKPPPIRSGFYIYRKVSRNLPSTYHPPPFILFKYKVLNQLYTTSFRIYILRYRVFIVEPL